MWEAQVAHAPLFAEPNGAPCGDVRRGGLAVQAGEPFADSFGTRWLPLRCTDGDVAFAPMAVRFGSGDGGAVQACWGRVRAASPEPPHEAAATEAAASGSGGGDSAVAPPAPLRTQTPPVPRGIVFKGLATLPSTGFLHGFQLQGRLGEECCVQLHRGSVSEGGGGAGAAAAAAATGAAGKKLAALRAEVEDGDEAAVWGTGLERMRKMVGVCEEAAAAESGGGCGGVEDWNGVWQALMECRVRGGAEEEWRGLLQAFLAAFGAVCGRLVEQIVDEERASEAAATATAHGGTASPSPARRRRSLAPLGGIAGDRVHIVGGVLLQRAVADDAFSTRNAAWSRARLAHRHAALLATEGRSPLLAAPLSCVATYLGTRFLCTALLPVSISSLLLGSANGGRTVAARAVPAPYAAALRQTARALNVRSGHPHGLNADAQVHSGADGRLYVTNLARLMPLQTPTAAAAAAAAADARATGWCSTRVVRPEALRDFAQAVNPDAFTSLFVEEEEEGGGVGSGGGDTEAAAALVAASLTHHVRALCERVADCFSTLTLPAGFAAGLHQATETCRGGGGGGGAAPPSQPVYCVRCHGRVEASAFRFHACRDVAKKCCWVCAECYVGMWEAEGMDGESYDEGKEKATTEEAAAAAAPLSALEVRCGRPALGLPAMQMHPSPDSVLHYHGVNLRHLGVVYCALRHYRPAVQHHLQVEMAARAFRAVLNGRLAGGRAGGGGGGRRAAELLRLLVFDAPREAEAARFWQAEVAPAVLRKFQLHMPFSLNRVDRELLLRRAASLLSVSNLPAAAADAPTAVPATLRFAARVKVLRAERVVPLPVYDPAGVFGSGEEAEAVGAFWAKQLATSGYRGEGQQEADRLRLPEILRGIAAVGEAPSGKEGEAVGVGEGAAEEEGSL